MYTPPWHPPQLSGYHLQGGPRVGGRKEGLGTGLLYRGAGQEWEIHDMDMAVTIGSRDMKRKINSKVIQEFRAPYPTLWQGRLPPIDG